MAADQSDTDSSATDPLDLRNDEGWEDVEPDHEGEPVICLFTAEVFPDAQSMLNHCKETYNFDLIGIRRDLDLDFLETVKLVNYVRSEVKRGQRPTAVPSKSVFDDEKYMKPVFEDDALLYSLDDVTDPNSELATDPPQSLDPGRASAQISELREELERLQAQFAEYRLQVQKSFEEGLSRIDDKPSSSVSQGRSDHNAVGKKPSAADEEESGYFTSYSYNNIHEAMLKDTIRTDAYRDFIYDNKNLFKDKVVLDVGCGTGILSMFCAKAGAKMVIAVDNSGIIDKARQIVFENGLQDTVKCLRGKIEDVMLPVAQVDVIVSEWMGYCLLFEAMLDSVLWARDHYLAPEGLMVPSHANLRIAPLADPDVVTSHVSFWHNVYGFKMTSMLSNVHDEVLVQRVEQPTVVADSALFLRLDLHTATIKDLTFLNPFSVTLSEDIDALDGWVIWFDMFFMPSRHHPIAETLAPADLVNKGFVAFSTGPAAVQTHWQQGVLLIKHKDGVGKSLAKDTRISGHIGYRKKAPTSRLLEIDLDWLIDTGKQNQQSWSLS